MFSAKKFIHLLLNENSINTSMRKNLILGVFLALSFALFAAQPTKIVILHTNDTHSQVEPLDGSDEGGYARRLGLINQIRSEEKNVILVDAGDFFQGTPYFNFYNGRVETRALKMMDYDAITFGNHEFDNGMDTLAAVLSEVKLPMIISNYDIENTPLRKLAKPYKIMRKGGVKIGIFGLGVDLDGLVFADHYKNLEYLDPVKVSNEMADYLKNKKKCDLVICLSHLGVATLEAKSTDYDVAAASKDIDVIIGGHSHRMIVDELVKNAEGKDIRIAQMGRSGLNLGRIDLYFEKK